MSAERQPTSIGEKLESIYAGVEIRTRAISELWTRSQSLSIPRRTDSSEEIAREKELLFGSLDPFFAAKPGLKDKFSRAQELQEWGLVHAHNLQEIADAHETDEEGFDRRLEAYLENPEVKARTEERDALSDDSDLTFAIRLNDGIETLLKNRGRLRRMQGRNEIIGENGETKNLRKYRWLHHPSHHYRGAITRVVYGKFSINLFIPDVIFARLRPDAGGFSDGLINHIRDYPALKDLLLLRGTSSRPLDFYNEVLRHEQLHSFVKGFGIDEHLNETKASYEFMVKMMKLERKHRRPVDTVEYTRELREIIDRILDAQRGEILAEFAESESRSNVPQSTFKAIDGDKWSLLRRVAREQKEYVPRLNKLSAKKLRKEIKSIYELVDVNIPEKRLQVDALFALFPPSKIGFIRRVVNRWVAKSKAEKGLNT